MIPCDDCIGTWEAYGEEPPCGGTRDLSKCDQVTEPLHEDNQVAWTLYSLVSDQAVMGPGGPVALSLPAVVAACDLLEIPAAARMELAVRVRATWRAVMDQLTAAERHQAEMARGIADG